MLKRIYLEISNICNVQCSFCPVVERDKKVMGLNDFENIIVQAVPLAEEICLHLMGEPLAHPKFIEILKLCEKYHAQIQLTTNGLLLGRYQEVLANSSAIRQINFSLQAFKDNFPHKKLDEYLRPILDFVKDTYLIRPTLYTNLRLWNQQSNYQNNFQGHGQDNTDVFDYIDRYFNITINRNIELGNIKSKKIWNRLYLHFDSRFDWPSFELDHQGSQGRCNGVLKHIGIHADGVVVPCCLDKEAVINLGNCKENSLHEILNNERTVAMRDGFSNGKLVEKLCQHCTYIKRFNKKGDNLSKQ